jgi:hypothetical protein
MLRRTAAERIEAPVPFLPGITSRPLTPLGLDLIGHTFPIHAKPVCSMSHGRGRPFQRSAVLRQLPLKENEHLGLPAPEHVTPSAEVGVRIDVLDNLLQFRCG